MFKLIAIFLFHPIFLQQTVDIVIVDTFQRRSCTNCNRKYNWNSIRCIHLSECWKCNKVSLHAANRLTFVGNVSDSFFVLVYVLLWFRRLFLSISVSLFAGSYISTRLFFFLVPHFLPWFFCLFFFCLFYFFLFVCFFSRTEWSVCVWTMFTFF